MMEEHTHMPWFDAIILLALGVAIGFDAAILAVLIRVGEVGL